MSFQNESDDEKISSVERNAITVQQFDVISGKSKESFNHGQSQVFMSLIVCKFRFAHFFYDFFSIFLVGNVKFREIINESIPAYTDCISGQDRSQLVQGVIDRIHVLGGRFLRKHQVNGQVSRPTLREPYSCLSIHSDSNSSVFL